MTRDVLRRIKKNSLTKKKTANAADLFPQSNTFFNSQMHCYIDGIPKRHLEYHQTPINVFSVNLPLRGFRSNAKSEAIFPECRQLHG